MKLFKTADNPIPPNPSVGQVRTVDGYNLRYARWRTLQPPAKGTVIILHGRTEFVEKYHETVTDLRKSGFEVLTFDWRGQGGSDRFFKRRQRGHVDSFDQYVIDLDTILENVALPDCRGPLYVLAHSTGGLVALLAAPLLTNRVERIVLTSPLIGFGEFGLPPRWLRLVTGFLSAIGLGGVYMSHTKDPDSLPDFPSNRVTSDTRRFTRNTEFLAEHPELAIGGPTAGWIFAAAQAMDRIHEPDFIASIAVPTLLISAGNDSIVSNRAIEDYGRRMRVGRTVRIDGAKHETLQERDVYREQVLAAFNAFVPGTSPIDRIDG